MPIEGFESCVRRGSIMRESSLMKTVSAAVVGLCVVVGTSQAQGKGHRERDRVRERYPAPPVVAGRGDEVPPGLAKKGGIPPGLAKKGGLPPGQAKKLYRADDGVVVLRDVFGRHGYTVVRTTNSGNARYVYYRLRNGTVRRAIVMPGSDRLRFRNVPDGLVREIYSRLY